MDRELGSSKNGIKTKDGYIPMGKSVRSCWPQPSPLPTKKHSRYKGLHKSTHDTF